MEDETLNNIFLQDYYNALAHLPEEKRNILLLYFDEVGEHSITAKEIGKRLGISPQKVYEGKRRALQQLSRNNTLQNYREK